MKKFLAVFLALLLVSFTLSVYADEVSHHHCVCGAADCTENHEQTGAADWQAWDGDTSICTKTDGAAIYLYLENNVTITETFEISNGVTVFFCLNGNTLTIDKEGNPAVRVGANQKFVLCDCKGTGKITGAKGSAAKNQIRFGTVNCQSGSSFVMYGGSIADNEIIKANGGGIYVLGGTFTMHGGSIKNNKAPNGSGGAISVENGKIYTYGGEMSGNSAINGGAIHLKGTADGEIRNIKANNNSASKQGGAIYTESRRIMKIYSAELGYNNATNGGGIYINGDVDADANYTVDTIYVNINDSDIHNNIAGNSGGGIYINGGYRSNRGATISNTEIHDNSAEIDGGGIVAVQSAYINLDSTSIADNTCKNLGGGIAMFDYTRLAISKSGSTTTSENITTYITGNSAKNGGGIYTTAQQFITNIKCEIRDNTAANLGGGVYIGNNKSTAWPILKFATITNNTALQGGGIYLNENNTGVALGLGADTSVIGNTSSADGSANNLYLNDGKSFCFYVDVLNPVLSGNERIGVSTNETPTAEKSVDIEYGAGGGNHADGDHSNLIIPDNDSYKVIYKDYKHSLIPKDYTVTFDPNNGEAVQTKNFDFGEKVSGFDYPSRDGYTFDAWYTNGAAYNFDRPVTGDLTLTARWISSDDTAISVTPSKIVVFRLKKPAVLFVASYSENKLSDIKKIELDISESENYIGVLETGLNTANTTKISAFLWENSNGNPFAGISPLCESAAAEIYEAESDIS